jgi:uncharacterized membrane protein YhaH (DUF805 family)
MTLTHLALDLFDPRGRCNRKGLLIIACALLALQVAAGLLVWQGVLVPAGPAMRIGEVLFLLMAASATSKRLHDIGLSALWILAGLGGMVLWSIVLALLLLFTAGATALQPGAAGFMTAVAGTMAPAFAVTLWLHLAKGEPGRNRFGPEPTGLGFSGLPPPARRATSFGTPVGPARA